ncbi:MAG: cytochrome C, partial [Proteobacteria bacterium]|nr:cytochrome C [Pseudomonadota bacterium]
PAQFPSRLEQLPDPSIAQIETDPKLAALSYQRRECQRCHIGVKGSQGRGDFRGMGCSACHMAYGTDGLYQGKDKSIPKNEPGHILRHRLSGNQKTGGIPVGTCNTCHNRGKRIGVSYTGMMESAYSGPFDARGNLSPQLHGKTYLFVSEDLHHRTQSRQGNPPGGLLCQDCHTSMDVHGDGNIHGTTLAQVEIECTDCHGTPTHYPWEMPIGQGDEFGRTLDLKKPRGLSETRLFSDQQFGYDHAKQDGFILSARGNPLGNVVRQKNTVLVHSALGTTFEVPVLKNLQTRSQWKTPSAETAMATVTGHMDRMECYACHSSWAPQCYGCHIKVDFSKNQGNGIDWVASGNSRTKDGQTAESRRGSNKQGPWGITAPGTVTEQNGYVRWEDPILGINGEGRISPLMPGCQVVYTVVARDGKVLIHNEIPLNPGEASAAGQAHIPLSIDMAPVHPHTNQARARSCESCHTRPKTLGMGINNGLFKTVVQKTTGPIAGVSALSFDWSQIVTPEGKQLATVGTHWPLSRAFNRTELDRISRTGLCMGCHKQMAVPDVWQKFSLTGPVDNRAHNQLMEKMLKHYQP